MGNKSTLVVDILQSAILHSVPLYAIQSLKMIVSTLEIISHHALSYAWQIVSRFTILGLDPEKKPKLNWTRVSSKCLPTDQIWCDINMKWSNNLTEIAMDRGETVRPQLTKLKVSMCALLISMHKSYENSHQDLPKFTLIIQKHLIKK